MLRCWPRRAADPAHPDRDRTLGTGGTLPTSSTPTAVYGLTGVAGVTTGMYHACARKSDGTVWCWGQNNFGQLGDGTNNWGFSPVRVAL